MMKEKIEQTLAFLNDAIETKKDKISTLAKQISEDALDARVDGPNFAKAALEKAQKLCIIRNFAIWRRNATRYKKF